MSKCEENRRWLIDLVNKLDTEGLQTMRDMVGPRLRHFGTTDRYISMEYPDQDNIPDDDMD